MKYLGVMGVVLLALVCALSLRFVAGVNRVEKANAEIGEGRISLPEVDRVEILPLVEFEAARPDLKLEAGLSYLIKTDRSSVLLDLGYNKLKEEPSPLVLNARRLGVDLSGVDAVAISHPHPDHAGGVEILPRKAAWSTASRATVAFRKRVAPSAIRIDGAAAEVLAKPGFVTPEVGSTGALMAQTFFTGRVPEASLLVNVRGKGLVVISGCGHPGIVEIARTAQRVTGLPLYAVVGGFHLYYGRGNGGILPAIFGGTNFLAWPETRNSVAAKVRALHNLGISEVYLSPHDSNDQTARLFREVFGDAAHKVVAGRLVTINAD